MKTRYLILTLSIFLFSQALLAQTTFKLDPKTSSITIEGTSSVHDWEMTATEMDASMKVNLQDQKIDEILNVNFSVLSEGLKSKNSLMDKKTYNALKSDKHNKIAFTLQSVNDLSATAKNLSGTAHGTLSIAGKTLPVTIPFSGVIQKDFTISVTGKEKINMKDFNISPPTAMMGTMKTGEEVTVHFNVNFQPESVYAEVGQSSRN
ncbi:MAG: YceI family protein [Bacteroidales bacterium]